MILDTIQKGREIYEKRTLVIGGIILSILLLFLFCIIAEISNRSKGRAAVEEFCTAISENNYERLDKVVAEDTIVNVYGRGESEYHEISMQIQEQWQKEAYLVEVKKIEKFYCSFYQKDAFTYIEFIMMIDNEKYFLGIEAPLQRRDGEYKIVGIYIAADAEIQEELQEMFGIQGIIESIE